MARIIPWKLPEVAGGSIGGYTPAPTPTPVSNDPYDLDDMVLSVGFDPFYGGTYGAQRLTYVRGIISISGVKINDMSEVGSVIATAHVTPGTDVWSGADQSDVIVEGDIEFNISGLMSMSGGSTTAGNKTGYNDSVYIDNFYAYHANNPAPTLTSTTSTIEVTSIKVYNSNGVVMQEWEPED